MEGLRSRVGYPIESLTPSMDCPSHLPVSQYAVNIGLALKGGASSKKMEGDGFVQADVNLLPETYKPWRPSAKQIYFACGVVAAIALLFPLYQLTSGAMAETATLNTKYNILNTELQRKQLEIANREPVQRFINDYNTIVNMGGGFTEDLIVIEDEADRLGVRVDSIAYKSESITITCQAGNYTIFRDYVAALRESGRFATVTPPSETYSYINGGPIVLVPGTG